MNDYHVPYIDGVHKHTHPMITNRFLRNCYALELREMRIGMRGAPSDELWAMRFGMESAFWGIQKVLLRLPPFHKLLVKIATS
jgi:hypothetical protein